jgi:cyclohexanecarboxyl-CoA dehydrogenase
MNPNPYIDEDLQALAEHARRFAADRVAPGFQERDKTRVLDRTLLREMGDLGFICPELPEAFGGLGLGCLAAGVIHEEIARADLSFSYLNLLASLNSQILSQVRPARDRWPLAEEDRPGRGDLRDCAHRAARRLGCGQPAPAHRT